MFCKPTNEYYRIIAFGPTGVGKSQFCNFSQRDLENSICEVSDSLDSCTTEPKSNKFKRAGINIDLIDTAGNNDTKNNDEKNLQKVCNFLKPKHHIDYIILLLNFQTRLEEKTREYIKILGNIFTPTEFYTHFCVVFTHLPEKENKKVKDKKTKHIQEISTIIKEIFDIKKTAIMIEEIPVYFINTEIDEDDNGNKSFDEKSQKTVDVILEKIKINVSQFPPIETENLEITGKNVKSRQEELEKKLKEALEEKKKEEQSKIQMEKEKLRLQKELEKSKKDDEERKKKEEQLKIIEKKQKEEKKRQEEERKKIEEFKKEVERQNEKVKQICQNYKIDIQKLDTAIDVGGGIALTGGISFGAGLLSLIGGAALTCVCPVLGPFLADMGISLMSGGFIEAGIGGAVSGVSKIIKEAQ